MRGFRMFLIALLLLAFVPRPALAAAGDVVVGGMLVLRIRTDAGGFSAAQRAVIVEQRITDALSKAQFSPGSVVVQRVNGDPAIFVGNTLIVTVDANHARVNGTTPELLAEVWARNLRLALPHAVPLGVPGP